MERKSTNSVQPEPLPVKEVDNSSSDDNGQWSAGEKAGTVDDQRNMRRMGKTQEFRRNFRFIPIFGFAAVLMSTWEGVLAASSYVLPNGGRAGLIWTYVVSIFGFGSAVLSMAEMASMAPTSGGQYHWISEFAPKSTQKVLSYVVGWFCVLGWQAGIAGQCFSVGSQIQGLIVLNDTTYNPQPYQATLLSIAAAVVCIFFNTVLVRQLPIVEASVLVVHIVGFFVVMIVLWVMAPRAPSHEVWLNIENNAGWPSTGLSFLVGLTTSVTSLIGGDSAVHMAEEVRDASRVIPLAMLWTLICNGTSGIIMAITFAYTLGSLDEAIKLPYFWAFIGTFYNATGSKAGATVLSCIITFLTLCSAITNMATGSRQMFAFARDNGLPFSKLLSWVLYDIPLPAILLSFVITALLSLINLGSSVAFNAILSIGIVSLLSSYLVSISCILLKRIRGEALLPRRWDLGPFWGAALNVIGLMYLMIGFLFAFFPIGNDPTVEQMNWASAVYGGVVLLAVVYYAVRARKTYTAPVTRTLKDL